VIKKQESQLSLTNRATRLDGRRNGTKHGTIPYVSYGFLLVCYSNFVPKSRRFQNFDFENLVTLKSGPDRETWTYGHSKWYHSFGIRI